MSKEQSRSTPSHDGLGPHNFENDELNVGHCMACNGFAGGLIHRLHKCEGCGCYDNSAGGWANIAIVVSDSGGQRVEPIGRYCPRCKGRPWDHVGRTGASDLLFTEHELWVALGLEGLRHDEVDEPAISRLRSMLEQSAWKPEDRFATVVQSEKAPINEATKLAEQWKGRADDAGRLSRAVLNATSRLWLWKNFVDGRPEYWAFDNPYPCHPNGDPITLGEPCGYADFKASTQGRHDVSEAEVIAAIKRAKP